MDLDLLDEDCGRLWYIASEVLSPGELQAAVEGLDAPAMTESEKRGYYWLPVALIPTALKALLQPYVRELERPTGWRWECMPPSICLPDAIIERLNQRIGAALLKTFMYEGS